MSRTKDATLMSRDQAIREMIENGASRQEIADRYGISMARVSQINSGRYEKLTEDEQRNWLLSRHEFLADKNIRTVLSPPQKVSPSGSLVYEPLLDGDGSPILSSHGKPVPDVTRPVLDQQAASDASRAAGTHLAEIAKLSGLYQKAPKKQDESGEYEAWMNAITVQTERVKVLYDRLSRYEDASDIFSIEAAPGNETPVYSAEVVEEDHGESS